jgi:hypothetical protein
LSALRFGQFDVTQCVLGTSVVEAGACAETQKLASDGFAGTAAKAAAADTTIVTGCAGTTTSARPSAVERVGVETGAVAGVMGLNPNADHISTELFG